MIKLILLIFALLSTVYSFSQDSMSFKIDSIKVNKISERKKPSNFKKNVSHFYEDKYFIASKSCSGEWGGTLTFIEKATGNEYECSSTCPVIVNNINGKYFITNTLAHLSGFSEILEIDNPKLLKRVTKAPKKKGPYDFKFIPINEAESKSTIGTKTITDSVGVQVLASFPFEGKLYHILTDYRKTFIADIFEKKFRTIQLLTDLSIWTYEPEVIITKEDHYIVFFKNNNTEGYLDIFKSEIKLYTYK